MSKKNKKKADHIRELQNGQRRETEVQNDARKFSAASIWESLQKCIRENKSAVIVLAVAAVIFAGLLIWIYTGGVLHGEEEIFNPYSSDEIIEFEKASVKQILEDDKELEESAEGSYKGSQKLLVKVKSGRYKGQEMEIFNYFGSLYGVPVEEGDGVTLTIKTHPDGSHSATVYEFNRIPMLGIMLGLFFLAILMVGGKTGLKSLMGLIFTIVSLFLILIPLLLKGAPTILTTFLMSIFVSIVCFTILGGVHRKTVTAFLGTAAGTLLAMLFSMAVQYFAKIDGYRLEDAEALLQLRYVGASVRIHGLLVAGIIISALGAVMDVAMSISSALEEVYAANPKLKQSDLFRSGMNIGRDMVGTMTNTLILAFLGCEFSLIIFLYSRGLTFYHLFSTAFVALETISGISASIGMVLAIPLTALISSMLITRKGSKKATIH